jgi:hypothetical protein
VKVLFAAEFLRFILLIDEFKSYIFLRESVSFLVWLIIFISNSLGTSIRLAKSLGRD